jgi:hypothetical protein
VTATVNAELAEPAEKAICSACSADSVDDSEHGRALSDKVSSVDLTRRYPLNADYPPLAGRDTEAIARDTLDDPFDAGRWSRNTADASMVVHEWFGLLNAWAEFPLRSER